MYVAMNIISSSHYPCPALLCPQVCRLIDQFVCDVAKRTGANKNVELNGRDNMKLFHHGMTHMIRKSRRIDGGWHISMAYHLHLFVGTTDLISNASKAKFGRAFELVFAVHSNLRVPVLRADLPQYQKTINDLLEVMVDINTPSTKGKCKSIKYHWPRHWSDTRRELGCSAAEKSLERKLGEIQKRNYAFTNARHNIDVSTSCNVHHDEHY